MSRPIHDLDVEAVGLVDDTLESYRVQHCNVTRDLVIAALDRVLNDGFTYGTWLDKSQHETAAEQCVIVSPTRSFMLSIGNIYDGLIGLNAQGVITHYDVDELLDKDRLVEETRIVASRD